MAEITAAMVKALRDKTGAGMMDCKKALIETAGDLEAGVDWLRKKGLAAAAKKAGRVASEGLIGVAARDRAAAVVEVNAETDFVARNASFQDAVRTIAALALDHGASVATLLSAPYQGGSGTVAEKIAELIATIGENIRLRRVAALSVGEGVVASYVHGQVSPGLGRIGVLVALESGGDREALATLGKEIAMHVAATRPEALTIADIAPETVVRERAIFAEQAQASGKPAEIVERMVEGRLRKYYQEVVLAEQVFVVDGHSRIDEVIERAAAEVGAPVRIAGFVRFALGEGVEKREQDFAAEVAAQLAG